MSSEDEGKGRLSCAGCSVDLSAKEVFVTNICEHRLCSVCWFSSTESNGGDASEDINHDFCGLNRCLLAKPIQSQSPPSSPSSVTIDEGPYDSDVSSSSSQNHNLAIFIRSKLDETMEHARNAWRLGLEQKRELWEQKRELFKKQCEMQKQEIEMRKRKM
eukprot:748844-Hanusia_phi.AAC.4